MSEVMKPEPIAWVYQNANTEHQYLVWHKQEGGRNWTPLFTLQDVQDAILAEREACAKVCKDRERANLYGVKECAAAIRARGNTCPPREREWVGLTATEVHETDGYEEDRKLYRFARAIEAKLKEKNT